MAALSRKAASGLAEFRFSDVLSNGVQNASREGALRAGRVQGGALAFLPPAIIIFGAAVRPGGHPSGALRRRVEAALAFGTAHPEALYVPTGGLGDHPPAEADVMVSLLRAAGVPGHRILAEPTGTDTVSSVMQVRRLLREARHRGPVFAATSAYHLPRCVLLLRLAGLPARACPPPPGPAATSWRTRWRWRLREIPAVPWDAALVLWLRAIRRL